MSQVKIKQVAGLTSALDARVTKALFDANTVLVANVDDTPVALTVGASTFVGRGATGNIAALSNTDAKAVLDIQAADIDVANGSFIVGDASGVGAVTTKANIPLSGFGAALADVALGGFKITGLAAPAANTDAVNKGYVDTLIAGGVHYRAVTLDVDGAAQEDALDYVEALITGDLFRVAVGGTVSAGSFLGGLGLSGKQLDIGDFILFNANGSFDVVDNQDPTVAGTTSRLAVSYNAATEAYTLDIDSAYVGQSSITTLGTITTGEWRGTTVATTYGGTGFTSYAERDLLVGNAIGGLNKLSAGDNSTVLKIDASGALGYAKVALAADVSGTLPIANGGTGFTSITQNTIVAAVGGTSLDNLSVNASSFVGRAATGNLKSLTQAEIREVAQVRQFVEVGVATPSSLALATLSTAALDASKVIVQFNGVTLRQGASYDYTITGTAVTANASLDVAYGGDGTGTAFEATDVISVSFEA